ncbi:MAG: hypothetical protein AAFZ65_11625, partial [Planctomycetota bacterium]
METWLAALFVLGVAATLWVSLSAEPRSQTLDSVPASPGEARGGPPTARVEPTAASDPAQPTGGPSLMASGPANPAPAHSGLADSDSTNSRRDSAPRPEPTPSVQGFRAAAADLDLLRAVERDPWIERRRSAWKVRRRWFAEPSFRARALARLCPHGGAAATPPGGKLLDLHLWLDHLARLVDLAEDPELRPAVAAIYGPWRGFAIDLTRAVEAERRAL